MKRPRDSGAWFRQPVVWLGAAIFFASIGGCLVMIVLAERHADAPVEVGSVSVMKVPLRRTAATDERQ